MLISIKGKGKVHLRQAEVAQGVPGRLRPRIFTSSPATGRGGPRGSG